MQIQFGILFAIGLFTSSAWACGGGDEGPAGPTAPADPSGPAGPGGPGGPGSAGPGSALGASPYDNEGFLSGGGGPVEDGSELNCDFESSCCWDNEVPPKDELQWVTANDQNNQFSSVFPGRAEPTGTFLTTYSGRQETPDKEAQFYSCSIGCTREDVKVTLRHWTTPGVVIQVCERDAFADDGRLLNCKTLPADAEPGPTTVTLPPSEFFDIVIVARNFNEESSAAAIDDIVVESEPCPEETVAPPPSGDLCCNFEAGNTCTYQNDAGSGNNQWAVQNGRLGNLDTGVKRAADGTSQYLGTELQPGETAVLRSESVQSSSSREMRLKYYEATNGIQFKGCVNSLTNCPLTSNRDVSPGDRNWKEGTIPLDSSAETVYLVAENTGENIGAVGVDEITLSDGC